MRDDANKSRRNFRFVACAWVVAGCVGLPGCAGLQEPYDSQRPLTPEQQQIQSLQEQLAVLGRRVDALTAQQQNNNVDNQLRDLRGQLQDVQHDVQQQAATLADLKQDQQRLLGSAANREGGGAAGIDGSSPPQPAMNGALPAAAAASPEAAAAGSIGNGAEETAYLTNFNLLQAGKLDEAIKGFRSMLAQYPQGRYADNAWYWLGSAYYVQGNIKAALSSFETLMQDFPKSAKIPDALVKIGIIQQGQNKAADARKTFQRVIDTYPSTQAAAVAKQRLTQGVN